MTAEMTYTGSDLLVQALRDEGVDTMFGYPGGAIIPVFDTLYRKHFNTLLVRHEQGPRTQQKVTQSQPGVQEFLW